MTKTFRQAVTEIENLVATGRISIPEGTDRICAAAVASFADGLEKFQYQSDLPDNDVVMKCNKLLKKCQAHVRKECGL
jgi:hypothetical protein